MYGQGHYNVTTSDSAVIVEGGEFSGDESTIFTLPFVAAEVFE